MSLAESHQVTLCAADIRERLVTALYRISVLVEIELVQGAFHLGHKGQYRTSAHHNGDAADLHNLFHCHAGEFARADMKGDAVMTLLGHRHAEGDALLFLFVQQARLHRFTHKRLHFPHQFGFVFGQQLQATVCMFQDLAFAIRAFGLFQGGHVISIYDYAAW